MRTKLQNLLNILQTEYPGMALGAYVNMVKRNTAFLEACEVFEDAKFRNSMMGLISQISSPDAKIGVMDFKLLRHAEFGFISGTAEDEENSIRVQLFFFEEAQVGFIQYGGPNGARMGSFKTPKHDKMDILGIDAKDDLANRDISLN